MKKLLLTLLLLSAPSHASDSIEFECVCHGAKLCKDFRSLDIEIKDTVEGDVCGYDGEFCSSLHLTASKKKTPADLADKFDRYTITNREYQPMVFDKGDILLEKKMFKGGRKIKNEFYGSAIVINQKGEEQLSYKCMKRN